jgi:Zn-dependent peptidase ImmA (M78 family)
MLAHPGPERTIHGPTLTHHRTQVVHAGWPTLIDLKRRWQVSLAALLLRAKNLGRMTDASYLTAVKALSARGWRRQGADPHQPPENPPGCGRSSESTAATASARPYRATS